MEKSPEAFRTISEVANELELPKHVLRFWEGKFSQLRPMKRGGRRRYYRPEDIELLRGIRQLLYDDGYTIRGVQRLLRERGVRFVVDCARSDLTGAEPSAATGAASQQVSDYPDLASEAAAHALTRPAARPGEGRHEREAGGPAGAREKELATVLTELEACRALLTSARREPD